MDYATDPEGEGDSKFERRSDLVADVGPIRYCMTVPFLVHPYDRRSGRPVPHQQWAIISWLASSFWFGAAANAGIAGYFTFWRGRLDGGVLPATMCVLFAAIAFLVQTFVKSRRNGLKAAIAEYENSLRQTLD